MRVPTHRNTMKMLREDTQHGWGLGELSGLKSFINEFINPGINAGVIQRSIFIGFSPDLFLIPGTLSVLATVARSVQ